METKYKISIPEPCQEDWNKMSPNENGRFCSSCSKNVVDFTTMLQDEIQHYFAINKNNKICGKFRKSQLDTVTIQIPSRVLYSQTQYHKIFLLALFISMGTTLFSCADKEGNKQKIDKVEIIKDTTEIKTMTVGMLLPAKSNDSLHQVVLPPPPKINQVNFKQPKTIKCGEVKSKKEEKTINETNVIYEDNTVYGGIGISVYPDYIGGMSKFYSFVKDSFKVSKNDKNLKGEIIASFIIEKDGRLNDVKIIKGIGVTSTEELTRVLNSSSKWYPGEENGKKRNCEFQLSLTIIPDTIKKSFLRTKIIPKVDIIQIKRITKYENDMF